MNLGADGLLVVGVVTDSLRLRLCSSYRAAAAEVPREDFFGGSAAGRFFVGNFVRSEVSC